MCVCVPASKMLRLISRNIFLLRKDSYWHFSGISVVPVDICFKGRRCLASVADDSQPKGPVPSKGVDQPHSHTFKVLYDAECNICMYEINLLKNIAQKRPVDFVDINSPAFTAKDFSGVTYEMAMKEMHVIDADGKVFVQGEAVRELYRACGLGWMAALTQLPVIDTAFNNLYMKFAQYRLEKALDRCESGSSCSVKLKHLKDKLRPPS